MSGAGASAVLSRSTSCHTSAHSATCAALISGDVGSTSALNLVATADTNSLPAAGSCGTRTADTPAVAAIDVAKQVLIGADYSNKDLKGATFNLSNLREADLSGSDLRGASLYGAKLQDANLSATDLREATLDSAVLTGTNLSDAVLEGAFAFNTRFKDVVIAGADFTDVPMRGDQLKSLCAVAEGTNPVTGRSTRDSLGCS